MSLEPLYLGEGLSPAYYLRYSWTGWPSAARFANLTGPEILDRIVPLWEGDGLRMLDYKWSGEKIQLTFSTTPTVSPVFLASRAKGRLQHALRKANNAQKFSRKLSVRSIGRNTSKQVETYIADQVRKARFADAAFEEKMKRFTVINPRADLFQANKSGSGRYWYNLHIVLEVINELPALDFSQLETARDGCFRISEKKGYGISRLSLMPDHVHFSVRGDQEQSPQDIALSFQNNLAYLLGQRRVWRDNFYAGTFGEYDIRAILNSPSLVL